MLGPGEVNEDAEDLLWRQRGAPDTHQHLTKQGGRKHSFPTYFFPFLEQFYPPDPGRLRALALNS